ncbi:hypothetical protein [Bdellovibrio bacteriovorus]|uniref:hypothetical protein n=1 Tax=Bdellovibrio bacteriovorus TaxID=959 RepID=UPI0035A571F6
MTSQKPQKENSMLLALLLFVGAAVMIFVYLGSEDPPKKSGFGSGGSEIRKV